MIIFIEHRLAEFLDRNARGEVGHEELVDMMLEASAYYNEPTMPREALLAIVHKRCPTQAALQAYVAVAFAILTDQGDVPPGSV
jgi:hypothetical protein